MLCIHTRTHNRQTQVKSTQSSFPITTKETFFFRDGTKNCLLKFLQVLNCVSFCSSIFKGSLHIHLYESADNNNTTWKWPIYRRASPAASERWKQRYRVASSEQDRLRDIHSSLSLSMECDVELTRNLRSVILTDSDRRESPTLWYFRRITRFSSSCKWWSSSVQLQLLHRSKVRKLEPRFSVS